MTPTVSGIDVAAGSHVAHEEKEDTVYPAKAKDAAEVANEEPLPCKDQAEIDAPRDDGGLSDVLPDEDAVARAARGTHDRSGLLHARTLTFAGMPIVHWR